MNDERQDAREENEEANAGSDEGHKKVQAENSDAESQKEQPNVADATEGEKANKEIDEEADEEANEAERIGLLMSSLVAVGEFEEREVPYLIDRGSPTSLCPADFVDQLEVRPASKRLTAIGGARHLVLGRVTARATLEKFEAWHDFWVTSIELDRPVIGLDFLIPNGMKVDPRAKEMNWDGGSMKLLTPATAEEELYVAHSHWRRNVT